MAKLFNRAKMTTATTGSGTVTLGSASNGFQTFAAAGVQNGDVVQYVLEENANFEIGVGTYSSSGTSLTRSPTESSNSNNAITLAGQATVSITAVAADLNRLQHGGSDKVTVSSTGASVTGNLAVSGTVDGRDVASDGSKLDGIESGATADQTAAQIRAKVEAATDSNVFTDADHTKLNGIEANAKNDQTITAGGGLTGGGTGDVTISHSDTSSVSSTDNSGNTFVQDLTFDTYGHVTAVGTGSVSVGNGTLTVQGTGALGGSGTFTANQSGNTTISISHDDTSSQASVNGSGRTYIQDITLDTYGHVTGLATASETVTNTNQLTTFVVEDGDGTEVTISQGKEWKFVEGGAIDINWTDTSTGSDGDPFDLTISHVDTSSQASVNNSSGTVIQDVTLDGYGHVTGLASVNLDGRYYTESEADSRFVNVTGDTMTGDLQAAGLYVGATNTSFDFYNNGTTYLNGATTIDANTQINGDITVDNGTSTTLSVKCDDGGNALVRANGDSQGTGALEVGQSNSYGGGISYNGDGSPAFVSGETSDNITFYRLDGGTRTEVFHYPYNSNTVNFNSTPTVGGVSLARTTDVGNGTLTVQGTGALGGSGTFTANQSGNTTISISHDDTSSQASVNNSGRTYIQDITLDTYGHITSITSATETVVNTDTNTTNFNVQANGGTQVNISAGEEVNFINGNATTAVVVNQTNPTVTFNHNDTSSQASVNNSDNTVIQDVTLDGYGHVTGLTSKALSIPSAAADATITLSAGTGLSGGGNFTTNQSSNETITFNLEAPYTYIDQATGNYGTIKVDDDRGVSWAGYAIRDDWVLMSDGDSTVGIYNDTDNEWALLCRRNAEVELFYNDSVKLETRSDGITVNGDIVGPTDIYVADQIIHTGDTDTYLQFHNANEFRVVTGGGERFEVANDNITCYAHLQLSGHVLDMNSNGIYGIDQIFHEGDTNTYMQFHAADQWRVVVGGSERLEVKNSSPHVLVSGDLNSTSDERLKKNIKPIDNALADICQLEGVTFDWKDTGTQGQGFIAQQVEPIIPDVVNTDEDTGMKSINYVGLIGHLVEAIKMQQTQIDDLKAEIQSMKS